MKSHTQIYENDGEVLGRQPECLKDPMKCHSFFPC